MYLEVYPHNEYVLSRSLEYNQIENLLIRDNFGARNEKKNREHLGKKAKMLSSALNYAGRSI